MSFIFGNGTEFATPQELSRRREIARALMRRNATQAPKTLWDGLNAFADAVGARIANNRLDSAEANGRRGATAKFNALFNEPAATGLPPQPGKPPLFGNSNPTLVDVLSDPWLSDEQRSIARSFLEKAATSRR